MRWLAVRLGVNNYKHDHIKLVLNKFAPAARRTKNCWVLPVCAVHWHLLCQLCCFSRIDHIGKPQYLSSMLNHPKYLSTHWPLTHQVLKIIGCFYDSYPPELELKLSRELCFAVTVSGSSTGGATGGSCKILERSSSDLISDLLRNFQSKTQNSYMEFWTNLVFYLLLGFGVPSIDARVSKIVL